MLVPNMYRKVLDTYRCRVHILCNSWTILEYQDFIAYKRSFIGLTSIREGLSVTIRRFLGSLPNFSIFFSIFSYLACQIVKRHVNTTNLYIKRKNKQTNKQKTLLFNIISRQDSFACDNNSNLIHCKKNN
jgi:hypothetical protein